MQYKSNPTTLSLNWEMFITSSRPSFSRIWFNDAPIEDRWLYCTFCFDINLYCNCTDIKWTRINHTKVLDNHSSIPSRGINCSLHHQAKTDSKAHPSSSTMSTVLLLQYMKLDCIIIPCLIMHLSNSTEQNISWKLIIAQLIKIFPLYLWNKNVHCHAQSSSAAYPVLDESSPHS